MNYFAQRRQTLVKDLKKDGVDTFLVTNPVHVTYLTGFSGDSSYLLLTPQLLVTLVFFYWPASQAVWQSFLLQDAFGLRTDFIWFENYRDLFAQGDYYRAMATTAIFSVAVAVLSLSIALMLAVQADKHIKGASVYKTLLIWPYAVAPAIAGVLWLFMFQPSLGIVALHLLRGTRPAA